MVFVVCMIALTISQNIRQQQKRMKINETRFKSLIIFSLHWWSFADQKWRALRIFIYILQYSALSIISFYYYYILAQQQDLPRKIQRRRKMRCLIFFLILLGCFFFSFSVKICRNTRTFFGCFEIIVECFFFLFYFSFIYWN